MATPNIIKHSGQRGSESYNRSKLHASIATTCRSVRTPEGQADGIAQTVCGHIETWLEDKLEVTSTDLRRKVADFLEQYHPDAAYLYKNDSSMM